MLKVQSDYLAAGRDADVFGLAGSLLLCGVAVCCSVLQCVAVCCSISQCVALCCSVVQCVAVCCSVLHLEYIAAGRDAQVFGLAGSVLHCVALHCTQNIQPLDMTLQSSQDL